MKDIINTIISTGVGKAFDKIQHPSMMKTVRLGEPVFNIIKVIYDKHTVNIILSGES